jgi:integrase
MYRKTVTREIPANTKPSANGTVKVRVGNKWVERQVNESGRMVVASAHYYHRVRQPNGKLKEVRLTRDRVTSEQLLGQLRKRADRIASGLESAPHPDEDKFLTELAADWSAELTKAKRNAQHIQTVQGRVHTLLGLIGCNLTKELESPDAPSRISRALTFISQPKATVTLPPGSEFSPAQLRAVLGISAHAVGKLAHGHGIVGTGQARAKRYTREEALTIISHRNRGATPATINGYRRALKAFLNWLLKRGLLNRLPWLPPQINESKGRKITRRAISIDDCEALANSVLAEGKRRGGMKAPARALLYRMAFRTLLRARALRELTPRDCHLDAADPYVFVRGETDKTGRARAIPIPPEIAAELKALVQSIPQSAPIWAMPEGMAQILRADLEKAGIPFRTADGTCDFHALRHSGATHLARCGVNLVAIAKIGGWKDIQEFFSRYGHYSVSDLASATRRAW